MASCNKSDAKGICAPRRHRNFHLEEGDTKYIPLYIFHLEEGDIKYILIYIFHLEEGDTKVYTHIYFI